MRMKTTEMRNASRAAENGPISLRFHPFRSAGRKGEDCYTFERFASNRQDIRTTYYYHYKTNKSWSEGREPMELTVGKAELQKELQLCQGVVYKR